MKLSTQFAGDAVVPLKVIVLVPCEEPKRAPLMTTDVPTGPDEGSRLLIVGDTEKFAALLDKDATVTTTG